MLSPMDTTKLKADINRNRERFLKLQAELNELHEASRKTRLESAMILAGAPLVRPLLPPLPVIISKMERARILYKKYGGTRQEMIALFMAELHMTEAGARTYVSKVVVTR
jgi:hypothetical protein